MKLFLVLTLLLLPMTAEAGSMSLFGGVQHDWRRERTTRLSWVERTGPSAGVQWVMPFDKRATYGVSLVFQVTEHDDAIYNYGLEYWDQAGPVTLFAAGFVEQWGEDLTGTARNLGGGKLGLRWKFGAIPFEISGQGAIGTESAQRLAVFAGLHFPGPVSFEARSSP